MGWGSGSDLMGDVILALKYELTPDVRERTYLKLIDSFEDQDWDTQDECMGVDAAFDSAMKKLHPDWDWDCLEDKTEEPAPCKHCYDLTYAPGIGHFCSECGSDDLRRLPWHIESTYRETT